MRLPHITPRQQALIRLIYRYRFLERKQLQAFLGHTDKRRISAWLKELREQHFIDWFYEPNNPAKKSKPAIYFLSLNGIRFLRQEGYLEEGLRKRYKDATRQADFIARCLLLADCCINMDAVTADMNDSRTYAYTTGSDYLDSDNKLNFLAESEHIHPHLCYLKEQGTGDELVATHNLLEVIDPSLPRHSLRKKLRSYVEFLASDEWEDGVRDNDESEGLPAILLACPSKAELIYAKRYAKKVLHNTYGDDQDDIPEDVHVRFATVEQIEEHGITGKVWEEA